MRDTWERLLGSIGASEDIRWNALTSDDGLTETPLWIQYHRPVLPEGPPFRCLAVTGELEIDDVRANDPFERRLVAYQVNECSVRLHLGREFLKESSTVCYKVPA